MVPQRRRLTAPCDTKVKIFSDALPTWALAKNHSLRTRPCAASTEGNGSAPAPISSARRRPQRRHITAAVLQHPPRLAPVPPPAAGVLGQQLVDARRPVPRPPDVLPRQPLARLRPHLVGARQQVAR